MEVEFHRRYFLRILEKTFFPGTSFISRLSIWAMRRSASSAHSLSISGCVGRLRLISNFSTRLILASAGSDSASLNTFLATTAIFIPSIYIYSSTFSYNNQFFVRAERPRSAVAVSHPLERVFSLCHLLHCIHKLFSGKRDR